ncbi:WxL domain-containing protein [Enterococcus faecalis]
MNKLLLTGTLLIGTSLGLGSFAQAAKADTTKTTSDITFTGGELKIAQAPSAISFGSHQLSSADQTYKEVDQSGRSIDSLLTVGDYRGQTNAGWTLTAKLDTTDFEGMDLSIHPKGTAGTTDYATFTDQTLNGEGQTIATVTPDKMVKEKPDTQFSLGSELHIPANTPLMAKQYTTTIDWNLQSAPQ